MYSNLATYVYSFFSISDLTRTWTASGSMINALITCSHSILAVILWDNIIFIPFCWPETEIWRVGKKKMFPFSVRVCFRCSVTQSCSTLCDPMDCSMLGLSVPHCLSKFAEVHVHCISDAIQPSHPLAPSSPSSLNLSQHQRLFQRVGCLASGDWNPGASESVLPMSIQGWFPLRLTDLISLLPKGISEIFSTPQLELKTRNLHELNSSF